MSSEPSFEAACRTLEDMFPDLDPIVVRSVLDAKDGNVNEATTKLLAMSRSKRGNGGGMSSSSGGGGGGGYGDAPRSESMGANGGEEINPYTKDARYDDARALRANAFSCAIVVVVVINAHREHKRGVCALDHHHLCARSMRENARPGHDATSNPRQNARHRVTKNVSRGNSRPSRAFERIRGSSRADALCSSRWIDALPFGGPQSSSVWAKESARVDFYYRSKETTDDD